MPNRLLPILKPLTIVRKSYRYETQPATEAPQRRPPLTTVKTNYRYESSRKPIIDRQYDSSADSRRCVEIFHIFCSIFVVRASK